MRQEVGTTVSLRNGNHRFTNGRNRIMADINSLAGRIDAEFAAVEQKVKKFQTEQAEGHQQRQKRLEQLGQLFDEMREAWRPRMELLIKKFASQVKATPRIVPSSRKVTLDFESRLAHVRLKFSKHRSGRAKGHPELRPGDHPCPHAVPAARRDRVSPECGGQECRREVARRSNHGLRADLFLTGGERNLPEGSHGGGSHRQGALPQDGRGNEPRLGR